MFRTNLVLLLGLCVAVPLAWSRGGSEGLGLLLGFLVAGGIGGLGAQWLAWTLRHRPADAFKVQTYAFLFKLAALLLGVLALRFVEEAALRADWRSFALSFSLSAVVVLAAGVPLTLAAARATRPAVLSGARAKETPLA